MHPAPLLLQLKDKIVSAPRRSRVLVADLEMQARE
jgi:hypothetical protein